MARAMVILNTEAHFIHKSGGSEALGPNTSQVIYFYKSVKDYLRLA